MMLAMQRNRRTDWAVLHGKPVCAVILLSFLCVLGAKTLLAQNVAPAITLPSSTPDSAAPAVPPEAQILPAGTAVAPGVPAPVTGAPDDKKSAQDIIPKSLFLSPQDHIRISNALADYQNMLGAKANGENPEKVVSKPPERERYFIYPQFFLESLVYHSPNDWTIRINGRQITPQTPGGDETKLSVIAIDHDKVVLRWKPVEMARVLDAWDKLPGNDTGQKSSGDNARVEMDFNAKAPNKFSGVPIVVDREHRLVTFTLRPNQTFSSFAMEILEGKVRPVTVDNMAGHTDASANNTTGDAVPVEPLPNLPVVSKTQQIIAPPPMPIDDGNSGLDGLMKKVQNNKETKP